MNAAARALEAGDHETAVSRAYYAAYHAIIAAFETTMGLVRDRWSHNFWPYFTRYPEVIGLNQPLLDLYELGIRADYGETGIEAAEGETALATAEAVVRQATGVTRDAQRMGTMPGCLCLFREHARHPKMTFARP